MQINLRLFFRSLDLVKIHRFYSAVGAKWCDGSDDPNGEWLINEIDPLDEMNLPRITAKVSGVEILFFKNRKAISSNWTETSSLVIGLKNMGDAAKIVKKLDGLDLFNPCPDFDAKFRVAIYDPDGRRVVLSDPHPFAL